MDSIELAGRLAVTGRRAAPRDRPALHLALLLATFYSTTLMGAISASSRMEQDPHGQIPLLLSWEFLRTGLSYSLCLLTILGVHEMGHYLACRRYGVDASLPYFLPFPSLIGTMGAFIRIRAPFPDRNVLFDVGAAGPIAGFLVALPVLVVGAVTAPSAPLPEDGGFVSLGEPLLLQWVWGLLGRTVPEGHIVIASGPLRAAWAGCLATAFNLFPVGQLDGGHIAYAVSGRFHLWASRAGLASFALLGLLVFPGWILLAAFSLFIGPRHPPVLDEGRPLTRGRLWTAAACAVILVCCFIPRPISWPRSG